MLLVGSASPLRRRDRGEDRFSAAGGDGDDGSTSDFDGRRNGRDGQSVSSSTGIGSNAMLVDSNASVAASYTTLKAAYERQRVALAITSALLACCILAACICLIVLYPRLRRLRRRGEAFVAQSEAKVLFPVSSQDSSSVIKPYFPPGAGRELPDLPHHDFYGSPPQYQPALTDSLALEDGLKAMSQSRSPALPVKHHDAVPTSPTPTQPQFSVPLDVSSAGGSQTNTSPRRPHPHPELKLTIVAPSQKSSPTATLTTAVNSDSPDTALKPMGRSLAPFALRSRLSVPVTAVPVSSYSTSMSPARGPSAYPAIGDFLDRLADLREGEHRALVQYKDAFAAQNYYAIDELRDASAAQLCARIPGMTGDNADFIRRMVLEELEWLDRRKAASLDENSIPVVLEL